eukprot:TRINITY_DN4215_c2_g1_i2.p4 TRINITY_DN4215_c2_g1~~TRINITY_DN4215_c2_g1_i2.p4  ORF type:complete len:207 (+),score=-16.26 TRINITY_DN4215_c2_g1_i2:2002-2622(+)
MVKIYKTQNFVGIRFKINTPQNNTVFSYSTFICDMYYINDIQQIKPIKKNSIVFQGKKLLKFVVRLLNHVQWSQCCWACFQIDCFHFSLRLNSFLGDIHCQVISSQYVHTYIHECNLTCEFFYVLQIQTLERQKYIMDRRENPHQIILVSWTINYRHQPIVAQIYQIFCYYAYFKIQSGIDCQVLVLVYDNKRVWDTNLLVLNVVY